MSVSSSSWGLGRAAVCDCGTPWTFLLPFLERLRLSLEGHSTGHGLRKEGILKRINDRMKLTKCGRVAMFGHAMSAGLNVIGKVDGHEAIYYFIEETETGLFSSLFKCLPVQLVQQ